MGIDLRVVGISDSKGSEINARGIDLETALNRKKQKGTVAKGAESSLEVIQECEKNGVKADFYIKTFHHHNYPTGPKPEQLGAHYSELPGYWCKSPTETADPFIPLRNHFVPSFGSTSQTCASRSDAGRAPVSSPR